MIMTKQQKQSRLEKRIEALKFIESLEEMKMKLSLYQRNDLVKPSPYEIKQQIEDVIKTAQELEGRLSFLVKYAEKWEGLE